MIFFYLDLKTLSWNHIDKFNGNLPTESGLGSFVCVSDEKLLFFGSYGNWGKQYLTTDLMPVYEFDVVKSTCSRIKISGDNPPAMFLSSVTKGKDDCIYIFGGGIRQDTPYYNDMYKFDPKRNTFSRINTYGEKPSPRLGHTATVIGENIYIFGGRTPSGYNKEFYCFNIFNSTWSKLNTDSSLEPCEGLSSAVIDDSKIVFFGGLRRDKSNIFYGKVIVFDLETNCWYEAQKKMLVKHLHLEIVIVMPVAQSKILFMYLEVLNNINSIWMTYTF